MSTSSSAATDAAPKGRWAAFREKYGLLIDAVTLIAMLALAFFGIAASDAEWELALPYWSAVTLLYGLGAFVLAWVHGAFAHGFRNVALRLVGHWLGVLITVHGIFYYRANDQLTEGESGLVLGMVFALATFLAGVHVQWRMMIIGLALAAAASVLALVEENLWLLLAISVAALVIVLVLDRLRGRRA